MKRLLILFAVFICFSDLLSQGQTDVTGLVLDESTNEVLNSVVLKLVEKGRNSESKTSTDLVGKFEFKNLSSGSYQLSLTRIGYKTKLFDFEIENSANRNFTIALTPVEIEIEKINVTATRTEQTLQKTPSSINLISSDEISQKNKFTFDEVLQDVQGVTINRTSGINVSALSIRGSSDVAGGGIGNRVLLLLDGRPSLTGDSKGALWSLIPVAIIERTEVVKGAFSSLYGSSAIGGVVNVITKKPTYKPYTNISINYGFYNKFSDSLKFSDNLRQIGGLDILHSNTVKKFSYLLNFDYKNNDGYSEMTGFNFYSGIAKFSYDLFANRDIELTFQYTNSQSGYPHYWRVDPGKYPEPYKTNPVYHGDRINKETQSVDFYYYAIPSSRAKFSSRFYYYKLKSISTYNPRNPVSIQYGLPGGEFQNFITSYNFGNINQMNYEFSGSNYMIAGTDVQWNVVRSSPADILYGDQQQNNIGAYIQDQWNLISRANGEPVFSTTFGGRFDYNAFVGGTHTMQLSPKISFLYNPDSEGTFFSSTSFRFLVGRAFRAPSIAEQYFKKELFGGFNFIYNPDLTQEEMLSFELGFRKQFKSRFIVDLAAYFNLYDDLIQYVNISTNPLGPFQVRNIAKSQMRGFEFLIDYNSSIRIFNEKFSYRFEFDYSYNDARDLSAGRKDDLLPYKPKHLFNFCVNLEYQGFNLNTSGKYLSRIEEVIFYKYEEPKEYFLLNMKISKNIGKHVNVFFAVNNIFDKFYQELERIAAPNRSFNSGINIEF
ncbi:MAG: TonB-dependent receptor [Ignavibacteriae bacterium]|nr:TonB-dependent receptor [Ignavibacteriota bacterium]